jgi:hypothetical protein
MKERPILFSAPMVRAILDGSKTQTRRIVKPQPNGAWSTDPCVAMKNGLLHWAMNTPSGKVIISDLKCPYGKPGDQLWVRETFHTSLIGDAGTAITYKAGPELSKEEPWHNFTSDVNAYEWTAKKYKKNWMPSIHMPRWASRIQLEVLNVRVERLQDISNDDAIDEGTSGVDYFVDLWKNINGPESWDANPWVWRIEFQKIERKAVEKMVEGLLVDIKKEVPEIPVVYVD